MPDSSATVAMGDVSVDPTNAAASEQLGSGGSVLSALGLSQNEGDYWLKIDDACLRFINPDIDGDGTPDALQTNAQFNLDFHL